MLKYSCGYRDRFKQSGNELVTFTANAKPPVSGPGSILCTQCNQRSCSVYFKTKIGQYVFSIPSALLSAGNNTLHVQVQYKAENKDIGINLPAKEKSVSVNFYPEGGNLVNGISSTVGWEVKSAAGAPLWVNALLYENGKVIDTISTNSYRLRQA